MMKTGNKKAVLLLHAFPLNKDMYTFQMEAFEKESITYVAVDYPGFGDNPPLISDYSIEALTDHIVMSVNQLGIRELIVIGDSMGGYIMFEMWRKYREYVKGYIFTATRAEADNEEAKKARYALIKRVQENGKDFLIDIMLDAQTSPATKKDERKMRTLRCIMATLVIAGKDDEKVTPPSVVKKIADGIDGAKFYEVSNSAHLPPLENPQEYNSIVIPFIKELFKEE